MRQRLLVSLAALFFLAPSAARAQNVVPNGDFATSVSGWSLLGSGTVAFDPEDSHGTPGSGSALLTNTTSATGGFLTLSRCVDGFTARSAAASLRWKWGPAGDPTKLDLYIDVNGYPNAGCTGDGNSLGNVGIGGGTGSTKVWSDLIAFSQTSPTSNSSFRVNVEFRKNYAGGSAQVRIDDVFVAVAQPRRMVVPASASIHGQNGTFFQTDVWMLHTGDRTSGVLVEHFCAAGQTCGEPRSLFDAPAGRSDRYTDFLAFLGDPNSSGALVFSWDDAFGPVSVLTRTYSPSLPAPTTGTAIAPLDASASRTERSSSGSGRTAATSPRASARTSASTTTAPWRRPRR